MLKLVQGFAVILVMASGFTALQAGEDEDAVVRFLEKRGALVTRAKDKPGKPAIAVSIGSDARNPKFKGADELAAKLSTLKGLEEIFIGNSDLTDKGLKGIGSLQKVKELWIENSPITDASIQ